MIDTQQAILHLIANGYAVYRVPSEHLPKVLAPTEEEVEELAMGKQGFTVNEFCMLYGISRTFFYELIKQGKGPQTIKLGRKTLIPRTSAEAWQATMEASRD